MTEAEIERACNDIAEAMGGMHRKMDVGSGAKGWPDRAYWLPGGLHFIVEFKRPGGRVSPMQRHRIQALAALGHRVYLLSSVASFRATLDELASMSDKHA